LLSANMNPVKSALVLGPKSRLQITDHRHRRRIYKFMAIQPLKTFFLS
jgi:hypothetical protein